MIFSLGTETFDLDCNQNKFLHFFVEEFKNTDHVTV